VHRHMTRYINALTGQPSQMGLQKLEFVVGEIAVEQHLPPSG